MRNKPFRFNFLGIDVFLPSSSAIGFLLIAYFALPTAMYLLDSDTVNFQVLAVAAFHALAIYLTIFIHELGHVFAAKNLGHAVEGIHLHIFGGHTAFSRKFESAQVQFWTAIAGPVATAIIAFTAYGLLNFTDGAIKSFVSWLMWSSIAITLVNLLPGSPLDGGQVLASVIWRITKNETKGVIAAGYGGYFVAALWLASPFLYQILLGWEITEVDVFFSAMIGVWLFSNARLSIKIAKTSIIEVPNLALLQQLEVKDLARRAISVDATCNLADALHKMESAEAGSILVEKDGQIAGILHEKYLENSSEEENQTSIAELAVKTNPRDWINFRESILNNPKIDPGFLHGQWIAVDDDGAIYGVLHRSDISSRIKEMR